MEASNVENKMIAHAMSILLFSQQGKKDFL